MAQIKDTDGILRRRLVAATHTSGLNMPDLTLMTANTDPYRLGIKSNHELGKWLVGHTPIHFRGIHYKLVMAGYDIIKPNGEKYANTDKDFTWLMQFPGKVARWLGYLPWESIVDERNDAPMLVDYREPLTPELETRFKIEHDLPYTCEPTIHVDYFEPRQKYQFMLFGEKSSLGTALDPVARQYGASLTLPTGQLSDTITRDIAKHIAKDPRPCIILYFSDADPEGYHMPLVLARKLQAHKDQHFHDIDVKLYHAGLTPEQADEMNLPSSMLKPLPKNDKARAREENKRAKWIKFTNGREQTEIDAVDTFAIQRMARDALAPFYDMTLASRCREAQNAYEEKAADLLGEIDTYQLSRGAGELLETIRCMIDEFNERSAKVDLSIDIEDPEAPEAELNGDVPEPLFDTGWDWVNATLRLKQRKEYIGVDDDA